MTDYFSSGISLKLYTLSLCLRRNLPSPLHMAFAWLTLVTQCKQSEQKSLLPTPNGTTPVWCRHPYHLVRTESPNPQMTPIYSVAKLTPGVILDTGEKNLKYSASVLSQEKKPASSCVTYCINKLQPPLQTWTDFLEPNIAYECLYSRAFCGFPPVSCRG